MPDQWIDDALPEHEPSDAFVTTLRDDLQRSWRGETRHVPTATAPVTPVSHPRRRWAIAGTAAGVAAAAIVTVVVLTDDDRGSITTGSTAVDTAPETAPDTLPTTLAPTSTVHVTPTTIDPSLGIAPLVGHEWVRVPTDDGWSIANELTLSFEPDGTVHGFDGCDEWTDVVDIDGGVIGYRSGAAVQGYCGPQQRESLDDATFTVTNDGNVPRLTITPTLGRAPAEYVAADTLATVDEASIVGSWSTMTGERLTLAVDGTAGLGACAPGGTWRLEGDTVTIGGFVPDEAQACTGGGRFGPERAFTTSLADGGTLIASAHVDGDRILLDGDTRLWLVPGPDTEPALDLSRGTIHGFGAGIDGDSEFVVDTMNGIVGAPSFDSGWYTAERREVTDGEDCYGGRPMRVVIWGDIAFGWLRLGTGEDETERLWVTSVGDRTQFVDLTRLTTVPPSGFSPFTATPEGLGAGSTVDDLLAAGVDVQNVTDTQATISGPMYSYTVLFLDEGVVTSIVSQNPGFC